MIVEDLDRHVIVSTGFQVLFGEYDRTMGGRMVPVSDAKTSNMECQSSPHQNTELDKLIYWPGYRQRRTIHHATPKHFGLGLNVMFASFAYWSGRSPPRTLTRYFVFILTRRSLLTCVVNIVLEEHWLSCLCIGPLIDILTRRMVIYLLRFGLVDADITYTQGLTTCVYVSPIFE